MTRIPLPRLGVPPAVVLAVLGASLAAPLAAEVRAADGSEGTAREHFDRGLTASNEQRFADAFDEFEAAYALSPDYRVLYNLGRVSRVLGRHVRAVEAFEAYLADGGDKVPEERRQEVARLLADERAKIAAVGIETAAGADVRVDGRLVGRAPLPSRVRVAAGKRTIEAWLAGHEAALRDLDVPAGATIDVALPIPAAPQAPPAARSLAPVGPVPALERTADDRGQHRRIGYVVAAVGLVATVSGLVLAYQGATAANDAKARLVTAAMPAPPAAPSVTDYDAAKLDYDNAKTRNRLGWAIGALGGAALLSGGVIIGGRW